MLNEIKGNVWDLLDENSAVCILSNNTINEKQRASMGGGIAHEALVRNPDLDYYHALCIMRHEYYLGTDQPSGAMMVRFPTKYNVFDYKSSMTVIQNSLETLVQIMKQYPEVKFYLPRPGCGIGGLDWENQVKPLCEKYLDGLENIFIISDD